MDDRFRTGTPAASVRQGGIVLFQAGVVALSRETLGPRGVEIPQMGWCG